MSDQLSLPYLGEDHAKERAAGLLKQVCAETGTVPNLYPAMTNAPAVLETYLNDQEGFREESRFNPAEREVISLSISRENDGQYCLAVHSLLAGNQSDVPEAVTKVLPDDKTFTDEKLRALSRFTHTRIDKIGWPSDAGVKGFPRGGYSETHILHIVLAIIAKTLSNYPIFSIHRWETVPGQPVRGYTPRTSLRTRLLARKPPGDTTSPGLFLGKA